MEKSLKVDTKTKIEKSFDDKLEAVSPTSRYLLSEVATLYILCIFELEIPINFSFIYDFFNSVFLDSHPRFSNIPIEDEKGRKMWKKVEVNVKDHIKTPNFPKDLSIESYSAHLDDYVSKLATSKLELHKPLWEVHNFNYPTTKANSTLIVKFHHAIGDGASLMGVVLTCFKRVDDPTLPLTFPSSNTTTSSAQTSKNNKIKTKLMKTFKFVPKIVSSIFCTLFDFGQTLRVVMFEDAPTPIRSGKTNMLLPNSSRVCSVNLSLGDVKRIKLALKVTVNDVVIGIISFASRLYIQETEQKQWKKTHMTASIIVNIRSSKKYTSPEVMRKGNTWGNKVSFIELSLPYLQQDDLTNPIKYIMKIHKIMNRKRNNMAAIYLSTWTLDAIRIFGGFKVASRIAERSWKNSSFFLTNLVGPVEQMSIANHPIKGFYFVPTGLNLSLAVSVMSYMEKLRIGLVVENDFIDHQRLVTCMEHAFHLILHAAIAIPPISVAP